MEFPTREQLFELADNRFSQERGYSITTTLDAGDIARYSEIVKDVLNEEANRVYWEMYPDAPLKIDPDNDAHNTYEKAWVEVRDQVWSLAPEPPVHPNELDLSHIRAACFEKMADLWPTIREEIRDDVQKTIDTAIETFREQLEGGQIRGQAYWESEPLEIVSNEDPGHKVKTRLRIGQDTDGNFVGGLIADETKVENPL